MSTSVLKIMRGKGIADAVECKDVVKMTSIEGQRCGVNGGQV